LENQADKSKPIGPHQSIHQVEKHRQSKYWTGILGEQEAQKLKGPSMASNDPTAQQQQRHRNHFILPSSNTELGKETFCYYIISTTPFILF
jgi:hypothetical protein